MQELLLRAGTFIVIILLGYMLKRMGVFKEEDFGVLSKITIRITLPAAIITSFAGKDINPAMLGLALLGFGGGLIYILTAWVVNARSDKEQKAFEILNLPGYNIGTFTLPFVQSFLGASGVIVTSLFDVGNAFICLGGAYGVASMVKDGRGFSLKRIVKGLVRSVPFDCYILVVLINLLHIQFPELVISTAQVIGNANAFMAMFMIGVGFKLAGDREHMGSIVKILSLRYGVAAVLAAVCYFLMPLPLEVRQTLVILFFSPIGSAVPGFTSELKGNVGLSSALNSVAIICSIVIILVLLSVML